MIEKYIKCDNIISIMEWKTNEERVSEIAKREKETRKAMKISRNRLSILSGVPSSSIRHFENTGKISLISLVAILVALNNSNELDYLFSTPKYKSIKDIIKND